MSASPCRSRSASWPGARCCAPCASRRRSCRRWSFPLFLLAVNSGGLEDATNLPGFPTDSYLTFALAVPFMQGALFSVMNAGTDLARDIETGFLNRLALTPLRGAALLSGLLAGAVVLGVIQAATYLLVGLIAGAELAAGFAGAPGDRRPLGLDHGRLRLDRPLRRAAHRLGRGGAGPLPGLLRLPLPLLDGAAARPAADRLVPRRRQRQPGLLPARGVPLAADRRLGPAARWRSASASPRRSWRSACSPPRPR